MFKCIFTIVLALSPISYASELCFSDQDLSFGRQAKCVAPLLKRVCDQSRILQSCEKNMNMISAIYYFVGQSQNQNLQDESNLLVMHVGFLEFARINYPLLYNIISYNSHH